MGAKKNGLFKVDKVDNRGTICEIDTSCRTRWRPESKQWWTSSQLCCARRDKVALALARGLEARQQLADAEGGSLSSEETARLLNISKTAVLKRLESGRLVAWREERLQAARFPRWQFDKNGQVLAGLEEVLEILNRDDRLDPWAKVLFFLQTRESLGGKRPLDLLREGKLKNVRPAAEAYVE